MNLMGYDAMAVGNHEFDKPLSVQKMQRELAKFPMLSASIYEAGEHKFTTRSIWVACAWAS
jgi:5'-nucleotidase/UDP-sugar diphosphatase